jgi:hypothetical protein
LRSAKTRRFYPALRKIIPQLSLITYPVKYVIRRRLRSRRCSPRLRWPISGLCEASEKPLGIILLGFCCSLREFFLGMAFPFATDDVHATLLNGWSRAAFLILTGGLLFFNAAREQIRAAPHRAAAFDSCRVAGCFTHEPPQNPTGAADGL